MTPAKPRWQLWVALSLVLLGLFGMHGLSSHGTSSHAAHQSVATSDMAPMHADALLTTVDAPAVMVTTVDAPAGTVPAATVPVGIVTAGIVTAAAPVAASLLAGSVSDGLAALCLTILAGAALTLLWLALARSHRRPYSLAPRMVEVARPFGRDPDPPTPLLLSISRC
ncbi:MAG: hypothetical protein ACR2HA_05770 [Nocardioides sp.]